MPAVPLRHTFSMFLLLLLHRSIKDENIPQRISAQPQLNMTKCSTLNYGHYQISDEHHMFYDQNHRKFTSARSLAIQFPSLWFYPVSVLIASEHFQAKHQQRDTKRFHVLEFITIAMLNIQNGILMANKVFECKRSSVFKQFKDHVGDSRQIDLFKFGRFGCWCSHGKMSFASDH